MDVWERMRSIVKSKMEAEGVKQKFLAGQCGYGEKEFCSLIGGNKRITDEDIEKFCFGMRVSPNDVFGCAEPGK